MARRGESLIEVIVSCTVLVLVFSGVLTMLLQSVNVNLSSRERTKAINEAQRRLANYVTSGRNEISSGPDATKIYDTNMDNNSCMIPALSPSATETVINSNIADDTNCQTPTGGLKTYLTTKGVDLCSYVTVSSLDSTETLPPLNDSSFQKIIAHVRWYARGLGEQEFDLSEIVGSQ